MAVASRLQGAEACAGVVRALDCVRTEPNAEQHGAEAGGVSMPGWLGFLLAPVIVPLAILAKLVAWPFERPVQRTRAEVAAILRAYLSRSISNSDWDAYVCVPIAETRLEAMRKYCVNLPWVPFGPGDAWLSSESEGIIRGYIAELDAEQPGAAAENS